LWFIYNWVSHNGFATNSALASAESHNPFWAWPLPYIKGIGTMFLAAFHNRTPYNVVRRCSSSTWPCSSKLHPWSAEECLKSQLDSMIVAQIFTSVLYQNKPKLNFWVCLVYTQCSHNTNLVESPTLDTKDGGNDSCRKEVWSDDKVWCLLLWMPILALFDSNFNMVLKAVPTIPTIPFHNSSLYYNYSS
jgi:hypothetical protein